jgi:asparagine synthase (glutamine-hydrolysing)
VPEQGIYAGWQSLEGSFAAAQPFFSAEKEVVCLFSGEIFQDPEENNERAGTSTKQDLGRFLVDRYEKEGEQKFQCLNGLFSGLLIDRRRRHAFLFNDRYGIERIYVYESSDGLYFASEAKALLRVLPGARTFDGTGIAQLLTFGCTLEWQTLFRGVQLLPGGSLWVVNGKNVLKKRYFEPHTWEPRPALTESEFESRFKETFKRILPRYFRSESSIGVSLTGGFDTRMITACMPHGLPPPVSYTFTGPKPTILDASIAARVAQACGMEHQNVRIDADFFANFAAITDKTVYVTDGCFGVTGAHEVYFNGKARELATTRLTGNFGSEILRGMSTLKPIGLWRELFSKEVNQMIDSCTAGLRADDGHPISFAAFREIPWNLFGSLAAGRSQVTFRTPYLDNDLVALAFQVPDSLRKSSLVALNLVRENSPVLGVIPTDRGRGGSGSGVFYLLKRLFCEVTFKLDYIYSESLPSALVPFDSLIEHCDMVGITGLHKFLRYRRWFRTSLASYLREALANAQTRQMPYWNKGFLERMAADHISGRRNYIREINAVLTLDAIERLMLRV